MAAGKIIRLALAGYGGVGRAFAALLAQKREYLAQCGLALELKYIIDKENAADFNAALADNELDMLVLATPTNKESGEPGLSYMRAALARGLDVVTADKGPVALCWPQLKRLAEARGARLGIGCTTGGALPAINGGLIDLAGSRILSIEGVLNGTSNFILDEMRCSRCGYEEALQTAREQGIAEADPTQDVEGWDTAIKLLILTNVLLEENKKLADISVNGITGLSAADIAQATAAGQKYRLVGKSEYQNNSLVMTVRPLPLPPQHPFYLVDGKNKSVRYVTDTLGDLTLAGGASGLIPAAAALLRDIINIQKG